MLRSVNVGKFCTLRAALGVVAGLWLGHAAQGAVVLSIDVNDTTNTGLTQGGFNSFVRTANPATYNGVTVGVTREGGAAVGDDDRVRAVPADAPPDFTEGALLRDFLFRPNGAANTTGLNIALSGLVPYGVYNASLWSYDNGSTGTRVSDWSANGRLFKENYTFSGAVLPTSNSQYRMDFTFTASGTGEALIKGRRDATSVDAGNAAQAGVFFNGLQLDHVSTLAVQPTSLLSVDFGDGDTQPGFSTLGMPAAPAPSVSGTFGDKTVTVSGVGGVNLDQRKRAAPVDTASFHHAALLQDFIFAGTGAAGDTGLDVLLEGFEPGQEYYVNIWSYDNTSTTMRVADWRANGEVVNADYRFDGAVLPATDDDYRFGFLTRADDAGRILIEARVDAAGVPTAPNAFINAIQVSAVPEPTMAGLMLVAGGLAAMRRRRSR